MALHIAIDARHLGDFGVGAYISGLVRALAEIDSENRYTLIRGDKEVVKLPALPGNFASVTYKHSDQEVRDHIAFPWRLRALNPDLVHIPLNRVPWMMPRPYVVTIHDMANLLFPETGSKFRLRLRRARFRRGLERAERIIAVSDATKRDVERLMGIAPERIRRVYEAPDPGFLHGAKPTSPEERLRIMERYQITYPYLLYAGAIRPHKNVPRLVEAFAVVRGQLASHPVYKDLRLVIIGDTISQYPAVRQAVIKSRVAQMVRFLGFVPFDTLRCFFESAAAFVFPSRYEGFGLPPLEAMACGTPVVVSNVSSLPEAVGDAAVFVNPLNVFDIARGINEALLDDPLRANLIRRGHEQAARFSWERTARESLEIYREAAGGR